MCNATHGREAPGWFRDKLVLNLFQDLVRIILGWCNDFVCLRELPSCVSQNKASWRGRVGEGYGRGNVGRYICNESFVVGTDFRI